jgi:hypothetical protein
MRKLSLALLSCLAFAGVSGAQEMSPVPNRAYLCDYTFPVDGAKDPGLSIFTPNVPGPPTLMRDVELYQAVRPNGDVYWDNRKVTFAFVRDVTRETPDGSEIVATIWELSKNPGGWSCRAAVRGYGATINAGPCTDGHARVCRLQ